MAVDSLVFAVVTLIGFATHQELSAAIRMLTTFVPLLIAWLCVAQFMDLYDPKIVRNLNQLWRVVWAMIIAAPLAAVLRSFLLNRPIIPVFVIVLGGVGAIAMFTWRFAYALYFRRMRIADG